jgi:hypothetical protein
MLIFEKLQVPFTVVSLQEVSVPPNPVKTPKQSVPERPEQSVERDRILQSCDVSGEF